MRGSLAGRLCTCSACTEASGNVSNTSSRVSLVEYVHVIPGVGINFGVIVEIFVHLKIMRFDVSNNNTNLFSIILLVK